MLIYLIKNFYFDFLLSNCPSDIIHYFLTDPAPKYLSEFILNTVSLMKEHIGQFVNLDYNLWCFQFIHVLKFHSQSNRRKQQEVSHMLSPSTFGKGN